jgi:serine/threonine protein kinase
MTRLPARARTLLRALAWALVALLALASLSGCGAEEGSVVQLHAWTLRYEGQAPTPVTLPSHLALPDRPLDFVLQADVTLPPAMRDRPLTLAFVRLPAIGALRVNGELATSLEPAVGSLYRVSGAQRWRIDARQTRGPTMRLELDLRHRSTQSAWIDCTPRLSASEQGDLFFLAANTVNEATALFAMAIVVISGFSFFVVWLSDRRRRAHGWFALEALGGFAFPAFSSGVTQPIFGTADTMVLGVQLSLGATCSAFFVHTYFGLPVRYRRILLGWLAFAIYGIAAMGPFTTTRWIAPVAVVIVAISAQYQAYLCYRLAKLRPRPRGVFWVTLAWPLAGILGSVDCMTWLGFGKWFEGVHAGSTAICVICFMRVAALSRDHQRTLQQTETLAEELAARVAALEDKNRENEALNDELQRQIAARSSQLADALARIGARHGGLVVLDRGSTVAGRYRVVRPIGSGGMGAVYEVERMQDGRKLALKVLHARNDTLSLARFAREAQIAAQIRDPHVVGIVDLDVDADGYLFLVMELVEGVPLSELRDRFGEVDFALDVLGQIADGLAAIHEAGVVHRDLKPANVLLREEGCRVHAKIADFGIAMLGVPEGEAEATMEDRPAASAPDAPTAAAIPVARKQEEPSGRTGDEREPGTGTGTGTGEHDTRPSGARTVEPKTDRTDRTSPSRTPSAESIRRAATPLTRTGVVLGTPLYMAPEVLQGAKHARPAADLYSLGVIAWLVLTRDVPFPERRTGDAAVREPPKIRERVPTLPRAAADAIDAALAVEPGRRPSAHAFAAAMRSDVVTEARADVG